MNNETRQDETDSYLVWKQAEDLAEQAMIWKFRSAWIKDSESVLIL